MTRCNLTKRILAPLPLDTTGQPVAPVVALSTVKMNRHPKEGVFRTILKGFPSFGIVMTKKRTTASNCNSVAAVVVYVVFIYVYVGPNPIDVHSLMIARGFQSIILSFLPYFPPFKNRATHFILLLHFPPPPFPSSCHLLVDQYFLFEY